LLRAEGSKAKGVKYLSLIFWDIHKTIINIHTGTVTSPVRKSVIHNRRYKPSHMVTKSLLFQIFLILILSAGALSLEATDLEAAGNSSRIEFPDESQSISEFAGQDLAYVQENGKHRALEEFSDAEGQFVVGDEHYVFAYGFDGTCLPSLSARDGGCGVPKLFRVLLKSMQFELFMRCHNPNNLWPIAK
jgi:hypothetical protein